MTTTMLAPEVTTTDTTRTVPTPPVTPASIEAARQLAAEVARKVKQDPVSYTHLEYVTTAHNSVTTAIIAKVCIIVPSTFFLRTSPP